jgi:hypothetical protein
MRELKFSGIIDEGMFFRAMRACSPNPIAFWSIFISVLLLSILPAMVKNNMPIVGYVFLFILIGLSIYGSYYQQRKA